MEKVFRCLVEQGVNGAIQISNDGIAKICSFRKSRQVERYLRKLKEQGRITVRVDRFALDNSRWVNARSIFVLPNVPKPEKIATQEQKPHDLEYDAIFEKQSGACAICKDTGIPLDRDGTRGLLCHKCSQAIGCFQYSVDNLQAAVKYLQPEA